MAALSLASNTRAKKPFGKEVEEVNWQDGIGDFAVRFDNFSAIPWILPHWTGEKKKRAQEIVDWSKSHSFVTRAIALMRQSNKRASVRTTGEELLKFLEINNTQLTRSLGNNPQSMALRTQLVQRTLNRLLQKNLTTIEQYRTLYLQAVMANSFGEVSSESLLLLKETQDLYYSKSQRVCEERIRQNPPEADDKAQRKQDKEKIVALSKAHLNILVSDKQNLDTKLRKILPLFKNNQFTLRLRDFDQIPSNGERTESIKKKLIANAWVVIQFMRCFPILHENAQAFADKVHDLNTKKPIGLFFKGYITVTEADLLIMAYRRGFKSQGQLDKIQNILKTTVGFYEQAICLIDGQYTPMMLNILQEYTNVILFLHNMGKVGKPTPRPVMEKYVSNAKYLLVDAYRQHSSESIKSALKKMEHVSVQSRLGIF